MDSDTQVQIWADDLRITPQGNLRDDSGSFELGNGVGLLSLVTSETPVGGEGRRFFRRLFSTYLRDLSSIDVAAGANIRNELALFRPSGREIAPLLMELPPIQGSEYFQASALLGYYSDFEEALAVRFEEYGREHPLDSFQVFLRSLAPRWKDTGKVSFCLAENKGENSEDFPFAFLVMFVYRQGDGSKPRTLPLYAALKMFEGNAEGMSAILAPLEVVSRESEFMAGLLESRRIFVPMAWTADEAFRFLQEIELYERCNIVVKITNLWRGLPPKVKLKTKLDLKEESKFGAESLLDFSVNMSLGGEVLTEEEIEELTKAGHGLVRLRGQWIQVDQDKIATLLEKWESARELAAMEGLTLAQGLRMLAGVNAGDGIGRELLEEGEDCTFETGSGLQNLLDTLGNPGKIPLPKLDRKLDETLRPYQKEGVAYLWRTTAFGLGACLADDMGLGKTIQILTLLTIWKAEGKLNGLPALLILPATLLANWKAEAKKFTPDLKLVVLHSSAMENDDWKSFTKDPEQFLSKFDAALVSYGMVQRLEPLKTLTFPAVLADEAQAIKNPGTKQSRAVRGILATRRIAMTGTPVENRLSDLWSLFDFINRGLLGSLERFQDFARNLQDNYAPVRKLTGPFILRRLKTDKSIIADLPDKTDMDVFCNLSKKQAALYADSVKAMERAINDTEGIQRKGVVLKYLTIFKQICNHPAHFLGDGNYQDEDSGKFQRLKELAEEIASRQEKLLVFTQYREMTDPLHDFLRGVFGKKGLVLHGDTPVKLRRELVEQFQEENGPPFFVLSLKAGGTGLNLTAANHVILFDRWWNPAVEKQAIDRAYRIGQHKNVLAHKFICRGTLEEKIAKLLEEKSNLAEGVLGGGAEGLLTSMTNEELISFIKLDIKAME